MAGCEYEIGHPETGQPQPAAIMMFVTGMPEGTSCDDEAAKARIKAELESKGVKVSAEGVALIETSIDGIWLCAFSSTFNLMVDDPIAMTDAVCEGRAECVEGVDRMRGLPEYKDIQIVQVSQHIGIREGKRIFGRYRLTFDDITSGVKFDDGICLVKFCVDVHKISADDERDHKQGKRVITYHIPYRALLPLGCDNLILAGRCISGDFYAHASYRVIGNVTPTGEAAGYAAALCAKNDILPFEVDGHEVSNFMVSRGYQL